jgi:hypothetical protein
MIRSSRRRQRLPGMRKRCKTPRAAPPPPAPPPLRIGRRRAISPLRGPPLAPSSLFPPLRSDAQVDCGHQGSIMAHLARALGPRAPSFALGRPFRTAVVCVACARAPPRAPRKNIAQGAPAPTLLHLTPAAPGAARLARSFMPCPHDDSIHCSALGARPECARRFAPPRPAATHTHAPRGPLPGPLSLPQTYGPLASIGPGPGSMHGPRARMCMSARQPPGPTYFSDKLWCRPTSKCVEPPLTLPNDMRRLVRCNVACLIMQGPRGLDRGLAGRLGWAGGLRPRGAVGAEAMPRQLRWGWRPGRRRQEGPQ